MITKIIDWEVRKELSKDDFLRIGVTWDCLKNLLCSSEALIIEEIIDWEVRKELSKDDFLRIGVTWDCLKNLLCSSEALIIEVMG